MDANELPTDVEALKAMVRKLVASNTQLTSSNTQLTSSNTQLTSANTQLKSNNTQLCDTVSDQRERLAAKDQQILELLKALRGEGDNFSDRWFIKRMKPFLASVLANSLRRDSA